MVIVDSYWKNKNIFITGINGFIGSNLAKYLINNGANVYGLVRNEDNRTLIHYENIVKEIIIIEGEITDLKLIKRIIAEGNIQYCFHLAAQVEVGVALNYPYSTWEANIRGTYTLLEAFRESHVQTKSIIIASSDKAYGSYTKKDLPYKEHYALKASYPYDTSKACADMIAQTYAKNSYGLPIIITRFANIYGPGQLNFSAIIPDCIRSALGYSRFVPRTNGTNIRDFLFVEDVIVLYLLVAKSLSENQSLSGEVFNAGTNEPVLIKELIKIIYKLLDNLEEYKEIKKLFAEKCSPHEIEAQRMDYKKVNKFFNWEPKTDLNTGLKSSIDWYRKFLKNYYKNN